MTVQHWVVRTSGIWVPDLAHCVKTGLEGGTPNEGSGTEPSNSPSIRLSGLVGYFGVVGAASYAFTWAFYTTFYARFGLSLDDIGMNYSSIGVRGFFLISPWWLALAALAFIRLTLPRSHTLLVPSVIAGLATAFYCFYVAHFLRADLINPGNYSDTPNAFGMWLLLFILCRVFFVTQPGLLRTALEGGLLLTSLVGLSFSTYGKAEAAASLVTREVFQLTVRGFPDVEVLSVRQVHIYPTAVSQGADFEQYLNSDGAASDPKSTKQLFKTGVLNKIPLSNSCVLFLGSANGVNWLWVPSSDGLLGGDSGDVLAVPAGEALVDFQPGSSAKCIPVGNQGIKIPLELEQLH